MLKRLLGLKKDKGLQAPYMPGVKELPDMEEVFAKVRHDATGDGAWQDKDRYVAIVTPSRRLIRKPCPRPGSMPEERVAAIAEILPPDARKHVVAIACNDFSAYRLDISSMIPFFGFLLGFAYIGHTVTVFEGHPTVFKAGCKDADVLIVDGGMVPYLQGDWIEAASSVMKNPEIFVHDRETFTLRRMNAA
ncbi:MAG: hypothetical protein OEV28_11250 [Nitrospirota bacterium]|nr:hypothetical protein [Nitrospirota bacterium]